jgi:hypothetical protein
MFRQPATVGAIFLTVLVIGGQIVGSQRVNDFIAASPIVTVAAALGIGAVLEYLGEAALGALASGRRPRRTIVRRLPEFTEMWTQSRLDRDLGAAVGFGRRELYEAVATYHISRRAPSSLIDRIDGLRNGAKDTFIVSWTVTIAVLTLSAIDDSTSPNLLLVGVVFVLVATEVSTRSLKRLIEAVLLEEQFLRETVKGVPPPSSDWGNRAPAALPGIGYFGPTMWALRMWRSRRAIARHRQRQSRRGKTEPR